MAGAGAVPQACEKVVALGWLEVLEDGDGSGDGLADDPGGLDARVVVLAAANPAT
ncbi:hypothetical protein ABZS99_46600 [Streptomyces sp. NPDC005463]|uniref:hypothetical protein n=1 Tax=Streptomyces sp. NPDC005463 TaxID=3154465 RepID=UPI0033A058EB